MAKIVDNASRDRKAIKARLIKPPKTRPTSSVADVTREKETTIMPKAAAFQREWRLALAA